MVLIIQLWLPIAFLYTVPLLHSWSVLCNMVRLMRFIRFGQILPPHFLAANLGMPLSTGFYLLLICQLVTFNFNRFTKDDNIRYVRAKDYTCI